MHNYLKQFNPFLVQRHVTQKYVSLKNRISNAKSEKTADFVNRFVDTLTRKQGLDDQLRWVGKSESEKATVLAQHEQAITNLVSGFLEIKVRNSSQKKSLDDAIQRLTNALEKEKLHAHSYHCCLLDKALEAANVYRSKLATQGTIKKTYGRDGGYNSSVKKSSTCPDAPLTAPVSSLNLNRLPIAIPPRLRDDAPVRHVTDVVPMPEISAVNGENSLPAIVTPAVLDFIPTDIDPVREAALRVMGRVINPASDDDLLHNVNEVAAFLKANKSQSLQSDQLVCQLMAEFNRQIDAHASKNDWVSVDRLTLKKFACADAMISVSMDPLHQFDLPSPSAFGLLPGYKTRDSATLESGKRKPVVVLHNGERLVVDNKKRLGEGGFGKVKTGSLHSDGTQIAIKRVPLNLLARHADYRLFLNLTKEVFYAQALNRVSSALFLNTSAAYVYDDGKRPQWLDPARSIRNVSKVAMVMAVAGKDGVSLASSPESPQVKIRHMQSMARALAIMHKLGLAHQDFKLDNTVLTDDGQSKLADFGFVVPLKVPSAKFFNPEMVGGGVPSPEARDVRAGKLPIDSIAFDKVDVYAFGPALASMSFYAFSLHLLPDAKALKDTTPRWVADKLSASNDDAKRRIAKLILACHRVNPLDRPSMEMIVRILERCINGI